MKKIGKYRDDGQPYFKRVPKKDAKQAAEIWGEGSELLTYLLEVCIQNGIKTNACCRGHIRSEKIKTPYISFEDQHGITDYLMEKMIKDPSTEFISLSITTSTNKANMVLYSSYPNREEFFRQIITYVKEYVFYHGPIEKRQIKGVIKGLRGKRYQGESPKEKNTCRKMLDTLNTTNAIMFVRYDAHTQVYNIRQRNKTGWISLVEGDVEDYLSTLSREKERGEGSLIQKIKDICKSASVGINQITRVGEQLQAKTSPQTKKAQLELQYEEEKGE